MKAPRFALLGVGLVALVSFSSGCNKETPAAPATTTTPKHEHKPPHGGTAVALGDEVYHLELVRDAAAGTLQAFILDGEMENFIRSAAPWFEVVATVDGAPQTLVFKPIANAATGETIGDTSLFEAQAGWLKTAADFDAVLKSIAIRGSTFSDVKFNFPKGNDKD